MTRFILTGLFAMALISIAFVFTGLHNIDNAWNIEYLHKEFGLNLIDTTTAGVEVEAGQLYNTGTMLVMLGSLLLGISAFGVGVMFRK